MGAAGVLFMLPGSISLSLRSHDRLHVEGMVQFNTLGG